MCEPHILKKIEDKVEEKMMACEMFTAFDITLALQRDGIKKPHRKIRKDIKQVTGDLIWRYGYQNTMIALKGIGTKATLYHPPGADIDSYLPSIQHSALSAIKFLPKKNKNHKDTKTQRHKD
jgi:hypothetical protein